MLPLALLTFCLSLRYLATSATNISISLPSSPPTGTSVEPNFLGISFELSSINIYFGNDTSSIPTTIITYLSALHARLETDPVQIRVGGNSMDSSVYVPTQDTMIEPIRGNNSNDRSVNFGPVLWDVLGQVDSSIGGATYLIGLSLLDPKNPNTQLVADSAWKAIGSSINGFTLGNEPDLYGPHGDRPNVHNYTTTSYMNDFRTAADLINTADEDSLNQPALVGPSICCDWDLNALLSDGYTSKFAGILKYISLQHYPQNDCFGKHLYDIPYYIQHPNTVKLAAWQKPGINALRSNTSRNNGSVIMTEFNSASCGGVPGVSDTFAVGSLWTIDYALQMASIGYSAAYIHTREEGVTYNVFSPSGGSNGTGGTSGSWTTNPPYYALLVVAEALNSQNGSIVTDLNVKKSKTDTKASVVGYAVYDAGSLTVQQLVLFNYANVSSSDNSSVSFSVPAEVFSYNGNQPVTVKYLQAQDLQEKTNITWGGQTFANVDDGNPVDASWAPTNAQIDCSSDCLIDVPGPGLAVVFAAYNDPSSNSGNPNAAWIILPNINLELFGVLCTIVAYSSLFCL